MVGWAGGRANTAILLDSLEVVIRPTAVNSTLLADLYERQGLSVAQIADRLGIAKSTALVLLKKAEVRRNRLQGRTSENYRLRSPYGWHVVRGKLTRNRHETRAVKLAQELRWEQGLGVRAIARELTAQGFRNRAGQAFASQTVTRMLKHPLNKK
jgi:predicted ArsR family transcriptional regulator